jgi:hypothetical protein
MRIDSKMDVAKIVRRSVKAMVRRTGFELTAAQDQATYTVHFTRSAKKGDAVRPLLSDPLDALHSTHGTKPASFECDIDKCIGLNGLAFGADGWHPYSAFLADYQSASVQHYEESPLHQYYTNWQPSNLQEAFIGLPDNYPCELQNHHAHLVDQMLPWFAGTASEADAVVQKCYNKDRAEHGCPHLSAAANGFAIHGPISSEAGQLEVARLRRVYESLRAKGYQRAFGDIGVVMIKRDDDHRFIVRNGVHRTAAMGVLGYSKVPATFLTPTVFDVRDVERWPQVARGVWDRHLAKKYVDHLFDFDSAEWAYRRGLNSAGAEGRGLLAPA